ncbi:MAG: hypothetical protein A3E78_13090 [Alphaproteobacteria bacterium RIFCSPHIGHO2_12_FULL_63_12]|nr:MAG: hypothetical protein A3E78_13090 [Alphaproteobacteria bacterium RIFCSPHIGHO2_12_FULL_63_12]
MIALLAYGALLTLVTTPPARAHESRPLFIELTEAPTGEIALRVEAPATVDAANAPVISMEPPCREEGRTSANPLRVTARFTCAVDEAQIRIEWPLFNPSLSTLVRVAYVNGETRTAVLDPAVREWRVPAPDSFQGVAASYLRLGVTHILGGVDHLLFLAGLLLMAGTPRRMLVTVTGFTLAHSVTLALAALGWLRVSIPATEAVIALSIVFLATEIARGDRRTLAWRRPALVASAFGLVHGAGFAAALGDIGLPKTETVAALLFFNLGVEAGQIAMIALAFTGFFAARRMLRETPLAKSAIAAPVGPLRAAGYSLGIVSGYWFIERLATLLSA